MVSIVSPEAHLPLAGQSSAPWASVVRRGLRSLADFGVRRRIVISLLLMTVLVVEDVLMRERPHAVLNWSDPWTCVGLLGIFAGIGLRSWAAGLLRKNRALATTGPYSLTRNPLYLGTFLLLEGFCILIGDLDNCLFVVLLGLVVYGPTILREEGRLLREFGDEWLAYAKRTPRLVPRFVSLPTVRGSQWSLDQWRRNREYNAVVGAIVALVLFQAWSQWPG